MRNFFRKTLACAAMTASVVGLGAIPAQAESSQEPVGVTRWRNLCEHGSACIRLANNINRWWNFDGCGPHGVHDYYGRAQAHGNAFRVFYQDGRWDHVPPWTSRALDPHNLIVRAEVYC